ncbi:hypothetical protein [Azospirillum sp. A23]|uniref:hypothetical protein n=1 Tax=Azospirillum sp. A23 TaxID=3160608 RepID=UPI0036F40936
MTRHAKLGRQTLFCQGGTHRRRTLDLHHGRQQVDVEALRLVPTVRRRWRGAALGDLLAGMPEAIIFFAHPAMRAVEFSREGVSRKGLAMAESMLSNPRSRVSRLLMSSTSIEARSTQRYVTADNVARTT